jgi:YesN/AraC family two-component response regulator
MDIVEIQDINTHRHESRIDDSKTARRFKVRLQQPATTTVSILIVEDNRTANKLIGRMVALNFPDAVVYSADNGATGVEIFIKHAPDIVLTDISMPEMNGLEMAIEIQSIKADAKFIVFTAHSEGDFLPQFKEIGVDTYLSKPLALDELMMAIDGCIYEKEHL